ncbi:cysteine hydrolase family protein [Actinokineospora inagensis]|uniref:cysteine hydrolase family protein n=1 Tax=Actinokineospora inagensis TaxID=103730 RepID=UPI0003FE5E61|nr:isochorismatase family cysteine hydrolase [Actinokineospora inagensis]
MADTALLVMDVQNAIVNRFSTDTDYLPRVRRGIDAARAAGLPVFFVRVGFRPGFPEVSPNNASFSAIRDRGGFSAADIEIHPALGAGADDVIVTKRRISAFTGSDLGVLLRAHDIRHLVLAGISTSGVVLSTLREAADLDYRLTVLSDGCLDADEEVHRVLLTKVFARQAAVTTVDEWVAGL